MWTSKWDRPPPPLFSSCQRLDSLTKQQPGGGKSTTGCEYSNKMEFDMIRSYRHLLPIKSYAAYASLIKNQNIFGISSTLRSPTHLPIENLFSYCFCSATHFASIWPPQVTRGQKCGAFHRIDRIEEMNGAYCHLNAPSWPGMMCSVRMRATCGCEWIDRKLEEDKDGKYWLPNEHRTIYKNEGKRLLWWYHFIYRSI